MNDEMLIIVVGAQHETNMYIYNAEHSATSSEVLLELHN